MAITGWNSRQTYKLIHHEHDVTDMKMYLVMGPEAGHLGVHHASDNSAYQPEMWIQFNEFI